VLCSYRNKTYTGLRPKRGHLENAKIKVQSAKLLNPDLVGMGVLVVVSFSISRIRYLLDVYYIRWQVGCQVNFNHRFHRFSQIFADSTDFAATEDRKGTRDERRETKGAMGNLECRILNDEGDSSCIFLLHRYQLFWVCFFSHCRAVFSYFSIDTSTAERSRSPAAMKRSGISIRCSTLLGVLCYFFGSAVAELNRTNVSQSMSPLSLQNIFENSLVNLLIICEYDFTKSSFFSLAL